MGTLASRAKIGVWVQAPGSFCGGLGYQNFEIVCTKSCNLVHFFAGKMVHNAIYNAFLNSLAMRMPFPCIQTAFQQNENGIPMLFPLKMTCQKRSN